MEKLSKNFVTLDLKQTSKILGGGSTFTVCNSATQGQTWPYHPDCERETSDDTGKLISREIIKNCYIM